MKTTLTFEEEESHMAKWYLDAVSLWSDLDDIVVKCKHKLDIGEPLDALELLDELVPLVERHRVP